MQPKIGMATMGLPGMAIMQMAAAQNSTSNQREKSENQLIKSGLGQSISLNPQTSTDIAEAQFSNDAMIQQVRAVLLDQIYIIMQKLLIRQGIEKLFNRTYGDILN